jgi:hypothetical protein
MPTLDQWLSIGKTGVSWITAPVRWSIEKVRNWAAKSPLIALPSRTFIVMVSPTTPDPLWWRATKLDGRDAMEICCQLQITNITREMSIRISALRVLRPSGNVRMPSVLVSDGKNPPHPARLIQPGSIASAQCTAWIEPRRQAVGEPIRVDLELCDQFNNRHRIKRLNVRGLG